MREDLVIRYLTTAVDRLDLVRRHLIGSMDDRASTENPTTLNEHGESTFDLIPQYLEVLQSELNLINRALDVKSKENQSE